MREVRETEGDEILRDATVTQRREKNKRIKIYYFGLA